MHRSAIYSQNLVYGPAAAKSLLQHVSYLNVHGGLVQRDDGKLVTVSEPVLVVRAGNQMIRYGVMACKTPRLHRVKTSAETPPLKQQRQLQTF